MFETRTWRARTLLQVVVTILVLPYLFPLVVMVKGSLAGQGSSNFTAVLAVPGLARFFVNSVVIAVGVIVLVYARDDDGRVRLRQAAHPRSARSTSGCCSPA